MNPPRACSAAVPLNGRAGDYRHREPSRTAASFHRLRVVVVVVRALEPRDRAIEVSPVVPAARLGLVECFRLALELAPPEQPHYQVASLAVPNSARAPLGFLLPKAELGIEALGGLADEQSIVTEHLEQKALA